MPLMAGSSVGSAWREPPIDMPRGTKLKEIHMVSYHRIDVYGFHAFEALQALVERRAGGETGVAAVQTLAGDEVWAREKGSMIGSCSMPHWLPCANASSTRETRGGPGQETGRVVIDYRDGLRALLWTLNGAVRSGPRPGKMPRAASRASPSSCRTSVPIPISPRCSMPSNSSCTPARRRGPSSAPC